MQLPIPCLPRTPFHNSKSHPTLVLKCPKNKKFVFGVNLLQEIMQIAVEDLLYSSFSLQSWCIHNDDSAKRVVLDWSLRDNDQLASSAVFWQRKFWSWNRHQAGCAWLYSSQTSRGYGLLHPPWGSPVRQSKLRWEQQHQYPVELVPWPSVTENDHQSPAWCKCSGMLLWDLLSSSFSPCFSYCLEEMPVDRG